MKHLVLLAAASGLALSAATPAQAAFVVTAYTGTVGAAFDATLANQSLFASGTNNASKATFTYSGPLNFSNTGPQNTTNAGDLNSSFFTNTANISGYAYQYGPTNAAYGPGFTTQANFLASSGSVGGFGWGSLYVFQSETGNYSGIVLSITHDDGVSLYVNGSSTAVAGLTAGPTTAITETITLAAGTNSYRLVYGRENGTPSVLNVQQAVPEPATWGMMIVGFGLMGGVLRRRKRTVAFA